MMTQVLIDRDERLAWARYQEVLAAQLMFDPTGQAIQQAAINVAIFHPDDSCLAHHARDLIVRIIEGGYADLVVPNDRSEAFRLSIALVNNQPI